MTIRVLLVDDQAMIRAGFKLLIDNQPDLEVVGEAETGLEALALATEVAADVILMDVQMPDMDGIEATTELVNRGIEARILIVTTFQRDDYLFDALRAGASGFLLKTAPPEELVQAVRVVAEGRSLLDPTVTGRVIDSFAGAGPKVARSDRLDELTEREREMTALAAHGLSNDEIAERAFLSPLTVKTHLNRAMTKLHARDRAQLVVTAYRTGLVRPGDELD